MTVPAAIESRVQWVAEQYLAITGRKLVVSDGPRTAEGQATEMIKVLRDAGRARLVHDYVDALATEVADAYDAAIARGESGEQVRAAVAAVIVAQRTVDPRRYPHIDEAAVDFSFADVRADDRMLVETLVRHVEGARTLAHGRDPHLHVAFDVSRPFAPPMLLIFAFPDRALGRTRYADLVAYAEALSRRHPEWPFSLHAELSDRGIRLQHEMIFVNGFLDERLTHGVSVVDIRSRVGEELVKQLSTSIEHYLTAGPPEWTEDTASRTSSSSSSSSNSTAPRGGSSGGSDDDGALTRAEINAIRMDAGAGSGGGGGGGGGPSIELRIHFCVRPGHDGPEDVLAAYFAALRLVLEERLPNPVQLDDGREPLARELIIEQLRALLGERPSFPLGPSPTADNNADYLRELDEYLRQRVQPRSFEEFRPGCGTPAALETMVRGVLDSRGPGGFGA